MYLASLHGLLGVPLHSPTPLLVSRLPPPASLSSTSFLVPGRVRKLIKEHVCRSGEMSGTQNQGVGGGEESVSLELLKKKLQDFNNERGWLPYHTPRNLLLALVGEMGELSEIFQWKGEVERGIPGWKEEEKLHLGEELSDVLLYLIQLSDSCGVDLGAAALRKLHLNALKYPAPAAADNNSN